MGKPTRFLEVDAAADAARKAVDRLIDLALSREPSRAAEALRVLHLLRHRMADAAVAAFPRAETRRQRNYLIQILGFMTPPFYPEVRWFLEGIAQTDPDAAVRLDARWACHE